jgi:hypothetical protein
MPLENWIGWSLTGPDYADAVLAITLSEAQNIALGLVVVFGVGCVAAAWVMKTIMQKIAVMFVLALLAFAVWTQRTSLQDCADKVKDAYEFDGVNPTIIDTDCSFFGTTITISDPRDTPAEDTG